jgi:DNA-binding CsgD family transcriptional regulator
VGTITARSLSDPEGVEISRRNGELAPAPVALPAPSEAAAAPRSRRSPRLSDAATPTVLVFLVLLLVLSDLVSDIADGAPLYHMAGMIAGTILSLVCLGFMWRLLSSYRSRERALAVELDSTRADLVEWRAKAADTLQGLGVLIDRQFDRWGLSPAERDVGLFLMKGFSFREIASLRHSSERTVRQQAQAVYSKADLAGRAELAAFFLEDLLPPPSEATRTPPPAMVSTGSD